MLRGYCEVAHDLRKARALLQKMEEQHKVIARPNVRTANTFLRGCLQFGAVNDAEALLKRMEETWCADDEWRDAHGGAPDASSYETVVSLLCQALRYTEASKYANNCLTKLGASSGSASMFVLIARAAAVCGNWDASTAAATKARSMLEKEEDADGSVGSRVKGSGGKRGMGEKLDADKNIVDDSARVKSLEIFQTHRRAELLAELKDVEVFTKKRKVADLSCIYSRTVVFGDSGIGEGKSEASSASAAEGMCRRLSETFGLPASGEQAQATKKTLVEGFGKPSSASQPQGATVPKEGADGEKLSRRQRKKLRTDATGGPSLARLNLAKLFEPARPVHLELCSGGGEWALAQAVRDASACWVACELRFDRSARCFQRMALQKLAGESGNLGLIVGDAQEALVRRLTPASCARLFINHPEPPHQTELEAVASSAPATHLLTADFLKDACGSVLQPGGIMTICTDVPEYGKWLRRTLASPPLSEVFEDAIKSEDGKKKLRVRDTPPSVEVCGAEYSGEAGASYFQRLKRSERHSRAQEYESRYFLCLRRL